MVDWLFFDVRLLISLSSHHTRVGEIHFPTHSGFLTLVRAVYRRLERRSMRGESPVRGRAG